MNWAILLPILAQYGLPFVENLFQLWASGKAPAQADFDALRALASQKASDRMKAALTAAGVPLDSPQAIALIGLAS